MKLLTYSAGVTYPVEVGGKTVQTSIRQQEISASSQVRNNSNSDIPKQSTSKTVQIAQISLYPQVNSTKTTGPPRLTAEKPINF